MRPHGFGGRPFAFAGSRLANDFAPSCDSNRPEPDTASGPSPPERNVQPLRRKSHSDTNRWPASDGSMLTSAQPVDAFGPLSASVHVLPPSRVTYRPRAV